MAGNVDTALRLSKGRAERNQHGKGTWVIESDVLHIYISRLVLKGNTAGY